MSNAWLQLSEVAGRLNSLAELAQAAAASGDLETARHFSKLAKEAEVNRQHIIVDLLCEIESTQFAESLAPKERARPASAEFDEMAAEIERQTNG